MSILSNQKIEPISIQMVKNAYSYFTSNDQHTGQRDNRLVNQLCGLLSLSKTNMIHSHVYGLLCEELVRV